jgi:hypothetical protein
MLFGEGIAAACERRSEMDDLSKGEKEGERSLMIKGKVLGQLLP